MMLTPMEGWFDTMGRLTLVFTVSLALLFAFILNAPAQQAPVDSVAAKQSAEINAILEKITGNSVHPGIASKKEFAVRIHAANCEYDAIVRGQEFANVFTVDMSESYRDEQIEEEYPSTQASLVPDYKLLVIGKDRIREHEQTGLHEIRKVQRVNSGQGLLRMSVSDPGEWIKPRPC